MFSWCLIVVVGSQGLMFIRKNITAVVVAIVLSGVVFIGAVWAIPLTNVHNRHNLSSDATGNSHPVAKAPVDGGTDRICVFCHTPHMASPESTLWSRPEPETATFDLYAGRLAIKDEASGSQYNSPTITYPNGASRMCMSCHDGATAIGTVLGQPAEIAMEGDKRFVEGSAVIDLSVSHPVSFVWDSQVETYVDAWHLSEATGSVYSLPVNYNIAHLDGNSRMQCTTCHDPHEDPSRDGAGAAVVPSYPPFWRHTTGCDQALGECYDQVCAQCHSGTSPDLVDPTHN